MHREILGTGSYRVFCFILNQTAFLQFVWLSLEKSPICFADIVRNWVAKDMLHDGPRHRFIERKDLGRNHQEMNIYIYIYSFGYLFCLFSCTHISFDKKLLLQINIHFGELCKIMR